MTQQINYKKQIQQGFPLIKEWMIKQPQYIKETEEFKELLRVVDEIYKEEDYSKDSYEDIRYILKPFLNSLSLKIKRIFNISTLDNYAIFIASRWFDTIDDYINLELSTSKFTGNMTKFFYNPIPLTMKTREFFDHLQTLYIYSIDDERFYNDERIIVRETLYKNILYFKIENIEKLEEWTGLKCGEVLFDSDYDDWSVDTSEFNEKIDETKNLAFIIENYVGEIFGYYSDGYNSFNYDENGKLDKYEGSFPVKIAFHFSLHPVNNDYTEPMKFDNRYHYDFDCGCEFKDKTDEMLIRLGDIWLYKKEFSNKSYHFEVPDYDWYEVSNNFYYDGHQNALCHETHFDPIRILVIQMI